MDAYDVLIVGAGPAGIALAAALCAEDIRVGGLAPEPPPLLWPNTYGIWADEVTPMGLDHLLQRTWDDCVVNVWGEEIALNRRYGLVDNEALQAHLLAVCQAAGVQWHRGYAAQVGHTDQHSWVTTRSGEMLYARLVIDASGNRPALLRRPPDIQLAYQAAYGVVGRFSGPPVSSGRMVLMDFSTDFLSESEARRTPPTFLYSMDLGEGRCFVEETSLAHTPAVSGQLLAARLEARLAHRGIEATEVEHVERCLFPMNLPLPDRTQPVLGYGGAASMIHPASGYQLGAALGRAPELASVLREKLADPAATPAMLAHAGWETLWTPARLRRYHLYRFGLQNVMRFDTVQMQQFFSTFFHLPHGKWSGYLSNRLGTWALIWTMLRLFGGAPWPVRSALAGSVIADWDILWQAMWAEA